eukprot:CAMPEP_0170455548 /NCGR_PEP_ID=MMETSP0123-20130129/3481_1 /TAXON_ID=182087 /ORGANISM="Favella ehrenbergii, Strain Fehren 1" /LENGTH=51 /DNA_ID=CAMNT_0010718733 /DNA_START=341 /DNA_END=496 /DNA_ORIENTATION=-
MCYKARTKIEEDAAKEEFKRQYLSKVLTHDLSDEEDEDSKPKAAKEPFKDV